MKHRKIYINITKLLLLFALTLSGQVNCQNVELISLASEQGKKLLLSSAFNQTYLKLSENYTTQKTQSYCGVASSVMVLNALQIKPQDLLFGKYAYFDQQNFFTALMLKKISLEEIDRQGLTLEQLRDLLSVYDINVSVNHAVNGGYKNFIKLLEHSFSNPNEYIITNFSRPMLGQKGNGHFSPIAAYDKKSNRILILDVARFKQRPFWVNAKELWNAMQTLDSTSKLTRGYLLISK